MHSFTESEAGPSGQLRRNAGESLVHKNFSGRNAAQPLLKLLALKIIWPSTELFLGKEVIKKKKTKQELTGEAYFHIGQKEFER